MPLYVSRGKNKLIIDEYKNSIVFSVFITDKSSLHVRRVDNGVYINIYVPKSDALRIIRAVAGAGSTVGGGGGRGGAVDIDDILGGAGDEGDVSGGAPSSGGGDSDAGEIAGMME